MADSGSILTSIRVSILTRVSSKNRPSENRGGTRKIVDSHRVPPPEEELHRFLIDSRVHFDSRITDSHLILFPESLENRRESKGESTVNRLTLTSPIVSCFQRSSPFCGAACHHWHDDDVRTPTTTFRPQLPCPNSHNDPSRPRSNFV